MTMHWGYKILVVIILFLLGMGYMVFTALQQKNEMYDEDYYAKELKYQSTIDAAQSLNTIFSGDLLKDSANTLLLQLPVGTYENFKEGNIQLLRADDKSKDIQLSIEVDTFGIQSFGNKEFSKGYYNARISWVNDTATFYREQSIIIE